MKISNKNTNPIYLELKKLRLINNSFLTILCNKTRDKKIRVIKDLKSNDNKLSDKYENKISKLNDEIKKLEVDKNNITKDFAAFKHQRNSIHQEKVNEYKNKIKIFALP